MIFPSEEWMIKAKESVNESEEYRKAAQDWEGDFRCKIDVDKKALETFSDEEGVAGLLSMFLSADEETRESYKGTPFEGLLIELTEMDDPIGKISSVEDAEEKLDLGEIAQKVSEMDVEEVEDVTIYMLVGFYHGEMTDFKVIGPEDEEDTRFELKGSFSGWYDLVYGKDDATSAVMSGKLELDGDMSYLMQNIQAVQKFGEEFSKPLRK